MSVRSTVALNNFSSGEISEELHARVDLAKYQNGCKTMLNWLPLIEGGIMRRPGTRFVAAAKHASTTARLIPFVFSTLQAYMLEFGDRYIRFYKDGGQIVDSAGNPIEVGTAYPVSDLWKIKYQQRADVLYLTCPGFARRKLSRSSHTDWLLEVVADEQGPFLDENTDDDWEITATGGELITNGTFTTDTTGWSDESVGAGTFTAPAGAGLLTHAGGADIGAGQTSFPTSIGLVYTVTFTVGVGAVNAQAGTSPGGSDLVGSASYGVGAQSLTFTATSNTAYIYFANVAAGTARSIDSVSCLKPLHTGAQVTLTANQDTWAPGHVGALWKISDAEGSPSEAAWAASTALTTLGIRRTYNGHVYEMTSIGTTGTKPPVHLRGTSSDGGNDWVYINDGAGYVEILTYNAPRSVTAIVRQHLPENASGGTSYWAEGAYSGVQGYPRAIAFIEQRTAIAGASGHPARIDMSEPGGFESFRGGADADRAISFEVDSGLVNSVLWMEKGVTWFAATNGAIYALQTTDNTPFAPDNLPYVKEVNAYGSADIHPLKIGGKLLYVQRGGKRVRELDYEADATNDIRSDRTVLARHITSDQATIVQWAYQQDPNQTVWAVRSDGVLLALTYFPEQDVIAWSRHTTQGSVESVATIPTQTTDQTWVVVKRNINGADVRYLEYFDTTVSTDCALTYQGPPAISAVAAASVAHLLGKTVEIVAHGGTLTPQTVTSSDLALGASYAFVEVGLDFDSDCETVAPEIRGPDGSSQGLLKSTPTLWVYLVQTNSLKVNGKQLVTRSPRDYMDTGPPYVTGLQQIKDIGHRTNGTIRIQQTEPLPAKVIGVFATFDTGNN